MNNQEFSLTSSGFEVRYLNDAGDVTETVRFSLKADPGYKTKRLTKVSDIIYHSLAEAGFTPCTD